MRHSPLFVLSHLPLWAWLLVDALAAFRLWRLVGHDVLTDGLRRRVFTPPSSAFDFITCPWCLGLWVTFSVVAMTLFVGWWWWMAEALALGAVVGLVAERA